MMYGAGLPTEDERLKTTCKCLIWQRLNKDIFAGIREFNTYPLWETLYFHNRMGLMNLYEEKKKVNMKV